MPARSFQVGLLLTHAPGQLLALTRHDTIGYIHSIAYNEVGHARRRPRMAGALVRPGTSAWLHPVGPAYLMDPHGLSWIKPDQIELHVIIDTEYAA